MMNDRGFCLDPRDRWQSEVSGVSRVLTSISALVMVFDSVFGFMELEIPKVEMINININQNRKVNETSLMEKCTLVHIEKCINGIMHLSNHSKGAKLEIPIYFNLNYTRIRRERN